MHEVWNSILQDYSPGFCRIQLSHLCYPGKLPKASLCNWGVNPGLHCMQTYVCHLFTTQIAVIHLQISNSWKMPVQHLVKGVQGWPHNPISPCFSFHLFLISCSTSVSCRCQGWFSILQIVKLPWFFLASGTFLVGHCQFQARLSGSFCHFQCMGIDFTVSLLSYPDENCILVSCVDVADVQNWHTVAALLCFHLEGACMKTNVHFVVNEVCQMGHVTWGISKFSDCLLSNCQTRVLLNPKSLLGESFMDPNTGSSSSPTCDENFLLIIFLT